MLVVLGGFYFEGESATPAADSCMMNNEDLSGSVRLTGQQLAEMDGCSSQLSRPPSKKRKLCTDGEASFGVVVGVVFWALGYLLQWSCGKLMGWIILAVRR